MAKRILPRNLVDRDGHLIAFSDREMSSLESEGLDYLRTVERMLGDLPVESTVRFGNPTEEILREADDDGADLIVVTTTGRNGARRTMLGSVAEAVFRRARVPVLLHGTGTRAGDCSPEGGRVIRERCH